MIVTVMKIERVKKGLSQTDLCRESGIPQWRISLIERGIPPKADELKKLSKALGISESDICKPA